MDEAERGEAVRRIAREADPDRSLSALFAPREARADLFALYAFNAELARVAELVSEPGLGAIRLQWWREAIERAASSEAAGGEATRGEATCGEATGHPVADAFGAAIIRRKLSRDRILGLIDARTFDVETKLMPDMAALDAYLDAAAGAVFLLAAEIAGGRGGPVEEAARQAGRAYGLTGLMRALPVHASRGLVFLPEDALRRHGTSQAEVLAGRTSVGLERFLAELRAAVHASADARLRIAKLDARAQSAFVPLALVEPYLAALEKAGRDPLREIADINPLYRLWRLARAR